MDCPYCGNKETLLYFKSRLPGILSACPKKKLSEVKAFPIEVRLCTSCGLGFNATPLDGNELKDIYENYLYLSPAHNVGQSIYKDMAEFIRHYCSVEDAIVEIGCSEGFLLKELNLAGFKRLTGIEPGPQADVARAAGLSIIKEYFEESTVKPGSVDVFLLTHVFEHFNDPFSMLDSMKKGLSGRGRIIIIVPNFSGYHHQHLFYYNKFFFQRLCNDKELEIVEMVSTGSELRCVFAVPSKEDKREKSVKTFSVEDVISRARSIQTEFTGKVKKMEDLLAAHNGKTIFWWGAGSASTIILNQISENLLENTNLIVVDSDRSKKGYFIPGTDLEVRSPDDLHGSEPELVIIASSLFREIETTMKQKNIHPSHVEIVY
ncbi:MAG: methyltransferase domain-containing protein [Methanoregula sp.]|nr:methyltransferase domain-containing protein [Methanoregula sp.]